MTNYYVITYNFLMFIVYLLNFKIINAIILTLFFKNIIDQLTEQ